MKTKTLLLPLAFSLFPLITFAQYSWQWAISQGGSNNDYITSLHCDADGNIFAAGVFQDTIDFFGETLISTGGNDVFIASFNSDGNLSWVTYGGGIYEDFPSDIYTDDQYIYVTGGFYEQAYFANETLLSEGVRDMFLLKYDLEGNLEWATSGGSVTDDEGNALAVDEDGNIYIVGDMSYTSNFGSYTVTYFGFTDIFIAQYDPYGICQWATSAGGPIYDHGSSIEVVSDHLFIGGSFNDDAVFDTATITSIDFVDIFIAHYLTDGTFVEVVSAGGTNNENIQCMAVDSELNVYISGWYMLDVSIGDDTFNSNGVYDIFLAKYEPGVGFDWAQSIGGVGSDEVQDMHCDANDNIIFAGTFENSITIGSTELVSDGFDDGFVGKLNYEGTIDWVHQMGGSGSIGVHACTADPFGNYYFAGDFLEELIIGDFIFYPEGAYDLFLAQLGEGGVFYSENEIFPSQKIEVFPNPITNNSTIKYTIETPTNVTIEIFDNAGNLINVIMKQPQIPGHKIITLNNDHLPMGVYFCVLKTNQGIQTTKMIKL